MRQQLLNRLLRLIEATTDGRKLISAAAFRHLSTDVYCRLRANGFRPGSIIDIGAYRGDWTREVRGVYDCPVLMIDALANAEQHLKPVCVQFSGAEFEVALLGSEAGKSVQLHIQGSGSSMFPERSDTPRSSENRTTETLDGVIGRHPYLKGPFFMKLDVQGAELDVLAGGVSTLQGAEVVQLEMALLPYNDGAPMSSEVVAFMDRSGFALHEIAGFIRPYDRDLVQIDAVFVRKTSPLRRDFFTFRSASDLRGVQHTH